ncbi:MAG: ribosomal RNA small subunit methyltransferase A [Saprospiraceae bacterium]|nr:ribosomal RNA small subunit methyltransferase A [Saprospiraceae bacterium]
MKVYAKKSFGQHFLNQPRIIQKIAQHILSFTYDNVLEIGPGKAALTSQLIDKVKNFVAIDADKDMIDYLHLIYPNQKNQLLLADVLKTRLDQYFNDSEFLMCGNFPYNISSQIVFKAIDHIEKIPILIGMFQKEMAQRIIANPGSKEYGVISAITSLCYSGKLEFDIGPSNFNPPPKVMSSILTLKRLPNPVTGDELKKVRSIIKLSFLHRRKTLRNNLKSIIQDKDLLSDSYFNQRPEEISPQEFLRLSKELIW